MNQHPPSLKFDHREVAVIFSLFIFVSLLMFTVGILVGKGLSQAKEGRNLQATSVQTMPADAPAQEVRGNSVTTDAQSPANVEPEAPAKPQPEPEAKAEKPTPTESAPSKETAADSAPLKLTPQKVSAHDSDSSLLEPSHHVDTEKILKNPKIQALLEDDHSIKRVPTALGEIPQSLEKGKFSVQVGSYPTEKEAQERVDALKKLGFPYAHFSAKQLPGSTMKSTKVETWYRVWIGEYPDYESANESGRVLQERGEVKHYLVRKSDTTG